eukprot:2645448-Prymnesium_polylepis.1
MSSADDSWSAAQQKALETALSKFPGTAPERWTRIAEEVPGKTSGECISRYKSLAAALKARRDQLRAQGAGGPGSAAAEAATK